MKILVPYFLRLLNYSTVFNARNWSWKKKPTPTNPTCYSTADCPLY